jgi:hypothetical protein
LILGIRMSIIANTNIVSCSLACYTPVIIRCEIDWTKNLPVIPRTWLQVFLDECRIFRLASSLGCSSICNQRLRET